MNCPMTGKPCANTKVFTIAETVGEFTYTTHCCRSCAPDYVDLRNRAAKHESSHVQQVLPQQTNATNLLLQMLGINPNQVVVEKVGNIQDLITAPKVQPTKVCPGCNSTLGDLRKNKRIGCKKCYDTFSEELAAYIPKVQGGKNQHAGKTPKAEEAGVEKPPTKEETLIGILRSQMQQAIDEEDYEKAAQCRDLIRKYGGTVEE